jgi:SAM-dependent methyltransferase
MHQVKPQSEQDSVRRFFKRWPTFYYAMVYVFGPAYLGGLNSTGFLKRYHQPGKRINLGSGPRRIGVDVINVDATAFEGVDVVANICHLPFADQSVAMIVCDNVLEHVAEAEQAVKEMYRVLQPGGYAYISTPFLYPYHSSPSDFHRWTLQGLEYMCRQFQVVEKGTRSGFFSSLSVVLCYLAPTLFSCGSKKIYWLLTNLSLFLFFPIKFLDSIANHLPLAEYSASVLYIVIKKP